MGAKESTSKGEDSGSAVEVRGELVRRIHMLDRSGDTIRFQYGKSKRGSRNGDYYSTVIVFQSGRRARTSEFYDDRDFMYYTVFRCLEEWTLTPKTNGSPRRPISRGNSGLGLIKKTNSGSVERGAGNVVIITNGIAKTNSSGTGVDKEGSPRTDPSPRMVRVSSQGDLLRDSRASKNYARIAEMRVNMRGYVDDTNYKSPNKEEILQLVKKLVSELVVGGDVPAFIMQLSAYDTGLVPNSNFPYYLNFRSNAYSSLSAQLMFHLRWYRFVLSVSPILDIRLSVVDLIGIRPEAGSAYSPLEPRPDDTNTPSWHYNGLLSLHPTLLQDLFTFETVLMCLPAGSRSELTFPEGTVLCKDTSQTLEKILAENPVLKARVKTLRK